MPSHVIRMWRFFSVTSAMSRECLLSEAGLHDLGIVSTVQCETFGEPGNRTFNITAKSNRGEATVWMEKEQLYQVGLSLRQVIVTRETPPDPAPFDSEETNPNEYIYVEFKTGEMALEHDPAADVFTLSAQDMAGDDAPSDAITHVRFSFSREQANEISKRSAEIVAAGRKPCPLCTAPLTPGVGHFCVKVNGYNPTENPMGRGTN